MKTHKFARKPFYVDAVRVSETNVEEVAQWCGGKIVEHETDGRFVSVKVHRPINDRQTQAFVGDWVLFAGTGFKVYTPKAFDKSFEKVKTLTKAQADEAGIKVPHEPRRKPAAKKPVPKAPINPVISKEVAEKLKGDEEMGDDGASIREQQRRFAQEMQVPEKDEADKLIEEVLREK